MMQELLDDVKLAAQQAQTATTRCAWADASRLLAHDSHSSQQLPDEMRALLPKLEIPEALSVSRRLARGEELKECGLNPFERQTVTMALKYLSCVKKYSKV